MKGFDTEIKLNDNSIIKSVDGLYRFEPEPKHILSSCLKNNPMSGICFLPFITLLYHKRKSIDWWRYKHRIVALLCMGIINSFLSTIEVCYMLYLQWFKRDVIRCVKMDNQHPLFVLGHPRTGTTLLHGLLALDEDRFSICDTFMVGFPHCFLWFEKLGKLLFKGILDETRPMDNMRLHFDLPQEDELGTNLLVGCTVSPYNSLIFMRDEREYRKYQHLKTSIDRGCSEEDVERWCYSFKSLTRKIKIRDVLKGRRQSKKSKRPRQLLLKSPCHTGRVRLLLKLFPNAKFVFIHRNPYEVFLSGAHMASTTYGWMFLQKPRDEDLQEYILRQGEILHNEYFSCREDVLNASNCAEVSFEELTNDPEGTIREIYSKLGFDSFHPKAKSSFPESLQKQCEELKGYQRNKFRQVVLDDKLKEAIRLRWGKQFEVLGYSEKFLHDKLL